MANPLARNGDDGIAETPEVASISFGERLEKLTGSWIRKNSDEQSETEFLRIQLR